ncbi:N-6 DNA methylase [Candidatus Peregrinibacteria bacterium]|nr:N-6 DNA methylase [Candidatus Peregrinibacteria bacterium]
MARSTIHYADSETNNILKRLHNKLRPAGTPVERVEYIIELLLLRIFEAKLKQEESFKPLRNLFTGENYRLLFSHLLSLNGEQILSELNKNLFPFYFVILSKARTVVSGNLSQKMQDQLVLMEEVFANSNFTNNVKGGVIAEVIGMVDEIDEKYILKTDLLGDAIESALSETGGTKDLGLYRTPDHIRQMMVEMVDPDFTDTIFDPACGTAGFLFDAYDYVIEKARQTRQFPAENIANMFYRTGIGGIEYQGRIRKMAAVNMYIRGLNPHNIDQGDSLKMYDPSRDGGSKSVVIANPPFGAERDQPAYPNVWEEYSKESETTILFVKLMFDLLKDKGRCAVVVSEGLLTWGQNSACALRKILLNEANLRAVISLPQGVFVSKSGQGAKTSILYFEKDEPTDFVWYYKIENDGFSMGTNRKPIEGNQIPELIKLFAEVKQGKKPQDTKHSFCVSKEQIETLDPRIAERIKKEVSEKTKEKNAKKREKLVADLDKKLESKKISQEIYDEKLWQFDNIIEGQIDNEVAKAIERAHSYHFNLQNYRSNLSAEQIRDWQETLKGVEIKNGSKIDKRYQELQKAEPQIALQILTSFDAQNALQMDIAREYLSKLDKQILEQNEKFQKLEEILRKGFQYPIVSLKNLIIVNTDKIKPADFPDTEFTILGVSNKTGVFINEKLKGEAIKQGYFRVYKNQFCYNPYRINVGSIGFCEFEFENQIISGAYNIFGCKEDELNPKYLDALFKTKKFLDFVNGKANGGVRMDFKIESMQEWQIPLPPLEVQNEIVEKIEKQKQIIEAVERIEENWNIQIDIPENTNKILIKDIATYITDGTHKTPNYVSEGIPFISAQNIKEFKLDLVNVKYITNEEYNQFFSKKQLQQNDVLLAKSGTIGVSALFNSLEKYAFYESLSLIRPNLEKVVPKYIVGYLNSVRNVLVAQNQKGVGVKHLHLEDIRAFEIPLPPLETQRQIVEELDKQMQAFEGVRLLKSEAQKRIEEILAGVWGE